jgi:hypothetical protein
MPRPHHVVAAAAACHWLHAAATAHAEEQPRMAVGASALLILPQADADDFTETSLGLRASFVYWWHPHVGAVGSFDYVFVQEDGDAVPDGAAIGYRSINLGGRVRSDDGAPTVWFGELLIGRHTRTYDDDFVDQSDSDLGFQLGGGVTHRIGPAILVTGQLTYSTVEIEDADLAAFILAGGVALEM